MCGIAGAISLSGRPIPDLERGLEVMNSLIAHRGPDDDGLWTHPHGHVGLAHRRLSIIDLEHGHQPMADERGRWITYNGEIYNYPELRREIGADRFRTTCDTEVALRAHERWGTDGLNRLRGMFAYALWDEPTGELVLVRDRFGIKPLYYATVGDVVYFASEAKALLPFLPSIETDLDALKDYLAFQFCLAGKTLFKGIEELLPSHFLRLGPRACPAGPVLGGLLRARLRPHRAVFRGADRGAAARVGRAAPAQRCAGLGVSERRLRLERGRLGGDRPRTAAMQAFTGKFSEDERYDESRYARALAEWRGLELHEIDISVDDFVAHLGDVVYHLDFPVAGPGSFPQFMVSQEASRHCKVILGGQGGDEIFGGYTRYLVAYFEQCIRAAIDGTMRDGNFVVTYESIIPNLVALRNYKPMLQEFWRSGLFEDLDARYFQLINRTPHLDGEVDLEALGDYSPFETFRAIFNGPNVGHQAYFDKMTHFDFKTLLPALLQVEDRVSMAHGLESAGPAARPSPRRAGGDDPGRHQVQGRHDEARLQALRCARWCRMSSPSARTRWASRSR